MLIPIVISIDDIQAEYQSLTVDQIEQMIDNVVKGLTVRFASSLEHNAEQSLHSTRSRYIRNIRVIDSGRLEGTVLLDYSKDPLVQMIEEGADAFDIKQGLLNSPKVKVGKKGGKYITVPFRFATPGAVGEAEVFTSQLPIPVYQVVKSKIQDIPVSGGGVCSAGLKLSEIPVAFQTPKTREKIVDTAGNTLFEEYVNKHSIYEGVVKTNDPTTGQNTYNSFRRVSEKSDKNAWIHPGITAHNLVEKTLGEFSLPTEVGAQLDIQLQRLNLI